MKLLVLGEKALTQLADMSAAREVMKSAFAELFLGRVRAPNRMHLDVEAHGGKTLLMAAHVTGSPIATKVVSFFPHNRQRGLPAIHGLITVLEEQTGRPVALLDGTFLTALRTGAGTAASIDLLARRDVRKGALFGTGGQAPMQLLAMDTTRSFERIYVASRSPGSAEGFVERMQPLVRAKLEVAVSAKQAVEDAEVIVASTNAATPVFDGAHLEPGCHVVGIGSITRHMQEVDRATVRRCRIFVDSVEGVVGEAGELMAAVEDGDTDPSAWTELGQVVVDPTRGRANEAELTYYKSVGHAVQDVAIANWCLERARGLGVGDTLEL